MDCEGLELRSVVGLGDDGDPLGGGIALRLQVDQIKRSRSASGKTKDMRAVEESMNSGVVHTPPQALGCKRGRRSTGSVRSEEAREE